MKIAEVLNEGSASNEFYVVDAPLKVWIHDAYEPTNNYVGASRIHRMKYKQHELDDGDEVHMLVGGCFFVCIEHGGHKVYEGVFTKPDPHKSPFEKTYGDYIDPNKTAIKKLVTDGKLSKIKDSERTKVKYRTT